MDNREEFIKQVKIVLDNCIGEKLAGPILQNNLGTLSKSAQALTNHDRRLVLENIMKTIAVFVTTDELNRTMKELEKIIDTA